METIGQQADNGLNRFLPTYQFSEKHHCLVAARPVQVYQALLGLSPSQTPSARLLMLLRSLPMRLAGKRAEARAASLAREQSAANGSLAQMLKSGFLLLEAEPPHRLVMGLVGRFWRPIPSICRLPAAGFAGFSQPGVAKAAFSFHLQAGPGRLVLLQTETRIFCPDRRSLVRFRLYWGLIHFFSGMIRRRWLAAIKRTAEQHAQAEKKP